MDSARQLRTWQDVGAARAGEGSGRLAAAAVVAAVLGALALLVASAARAPVSFDQLPELTQAP